MYISHALLRWLFCIVALSLPAAATVSCDYLESGPSGRRSDAVEGNAKTLAKIIGLERLTQTTSFSGVGDNWHMTWASDDKIYTALCDGFGWLGMPRQYYNTRLYVINGSPPDHEFEYLNEFPIIGNVGLHYGFAILALNDTYIYHYLSQRARPHDGEFIGIKLIYSDDNGRTWYNQDGTTPVHYETFEQRNERNMLFWHEPDECFGLLTCLQMGQNYELNEDGYAYVYGTNGYVDGTMNELVMFRIPIDRNDLEATRKNMLNRDAYEFFVSRQSDGAARWSHKIERRGAVHTFPLGWVNGGDPYA